METRDPDRLPDEPLHCFDPVSAEPGATISELAEAIELRLQLIAARTHLAIARGWDSGRISRQDPDYYALTVANELLGGKRGGAARQLPARALTSRSARSPVPPSEIVTRKEEPMRRNTPLRAVPLVVCLCACDEDPTGPRCRPR